MAGPAAMRQMFVRLGFNNPTATSITDDQGINDLNELEFLNDHGVETLCKRLARPGGTIVNPNAGPGQPARIPNPGLAVSIKAEENLKLTAYYLRHIKRISRTAVIAEIDSARVRTMRELKDSEESHVPPTDKPIINHKNWSKTIEAVEEYFRNHLGESKIPLAYVVRCDDEVTPAADDPPTNYETIQDEMIARAPHTVPGPPMMKHPKFIMDNRKVWDIISGITRENKCWSYVKPYQRKRDGRGAFLNLVDHYLGPNNVNHMADEAETKLANARYSKEGKRWNFESYVTLHTEQHQILQQLEDDGLNKGIDETSKVRHFLNGITNPDLNFLKAQVLSMPRLRNNFDACITLYKDYIKASSNDRDWTLTISKVDTTRKDGKGRKFKRTAHVGTKRKHADLGSDSNDSDSDGDGDGETSESHDDDSTGDDDNTGDDSDGDSDGDTSGNGSHNNSDPSDSESHNDDHNSPADADVRDHDDQNTSSDDDYDDVEEQDVDDRYYTPKEYSWMSRGQRKRLKRLNKQHREV